VLARHDSRLKDEHRPAVSWWRTSQAAGGGVAVRTCGARPRDGYTLMLGDSGALAYQPRANPKRLTYHTLKDLGLITPLPPPCRPSWC